MPAEKDYVGLRRNAIRKTAPGIKWTSFFNDEINKKILMLSLL
jgi:hypothetical protein